MRQALHILIYAITIKEGPSYLNARTDVKLKSKVSDSTPFRPQNESESSVFTERVVLY